VGYLVGLLLFYITELWLLALLTGELFGLLSVLLRGRIFIIDDEPFTPELDFAAKLSLTFFGAEVLSTFIFNADRIILRSLIGSEAVADYYVASLFGKTAALLTVPLSGVVIGYLAKYKGVLSHKLMNMITAGAGIGIFLGSAACTVASNIFIPIIYPDRLDAVKAYFVSANLSQILYFASNVITVILLRFARSKYQLYVNAAYAVAFVLICIPCAIFGGLRAFCIGLALTCLIRFLFAAGLGYYTVFLKKQNL
jgi:O-antigen/teichoic acid export membrane protein